MESIISIIKRDVLHERFCDIAALAKESDPAEWEKVRAEIRAAHTKLEEKGCRKEALELDSAFTSEEVELQRAAYMIGLADGMALARFEQEHEKRESASTS